MELPLTFGLGAADQVDELTIAWPSGQTTELKRIKADRVYRVVEGKGIEEAGK